MRRVWLTVFFIPIIFTMVAAGFNYPLYGNPRDKVDSARQDVVELENAIKELNASIKTRENRVKGLEKELVETEKQLKIYTRELAAAEIRLGDTTQKFAARVRNAYLKGGLSYLEVLLAADNFGDLIVRTAYLTRILSRDALLVGSIKEERELITARKIAMETQKKTIEDLSYQREAEHRNLVAQHKELAVMLNAARGKLAVELEKITPQAERKPTYGVIIDNHGQARPQHGLSKASLIYEYEVEGRITRYLALFSTLPSKVGPIRSARVHSAMLAKENGVHYIYASGGLDVLDNIGKLKMSHTNALNSGSTSFYRDSTRKSPHNFYVNLSTVKLASQSQTVVIRPAYLSRQGSSGKTVSVEYSGSYRIRYEYLEDKGVYQRLINGNPHRDASGAGMLARNIIIQYAPHFIDLRGRPTPNLLGAGAIDFYCQGQHFQGTWKKDSEGSPTRFYYQDGQEIERIYGQTWIQIVRPR